VRCSSRKLPLLDELDQGLVRRDRGGACWEAKYERLFGRRFEVVDTRAD
jgi:hypothetical protein